MPVLESSDWLSLVTPPMLLVAAWLVGLRLLSGRIITQAQRVMMLSWLV